MDEIDKVDKINRVTIAMSVFNAENYLEQQLQSLTLQSYKNWKLLVRNNGSTDRTLAILKDFQNLQGKDRVKIINTKHTINQVYNSFAQLVDKIRTRYVMLCDGDDFWLPEKIKDAVKEISKMEIIHGSEVPLLYHTDLTLVDHELSPFAISMWKAQRLNPNRKHAINCLMHNHAIGNTFIFNQALKAKVKLRPCYLIMHDVFYLTIASLFGVVSYGKKSHTLYRQHSGNVVGGEVLYGWKSLYGKLNPRMIKRAINKKCQLAKEILALHGNQMSPSDFSAFQDIAKIPSSSWLRRRFYLLKHRVFMNGFLRTLALFIFV